MVRVSYDYDLMTVLARHLWHLRDELDVTSQADKTFSAGDIGPRRETAEAMEDFYGAWKKSFREGWQVMTDLGNLLDKAGKAFYDQDASHAAGAAQQVTSTVREDVRRQHEAYNQRLDGVRREAKIKALEAQYEKEQARLKKEQEAVQAKQREIDKQLEAQQKRQEALNKEYEELREKQEPLTKRQDELQQKQLQLWQEEKDLLQQREEELRAKQAELQKEYDALREEQAPLLKRQEELQRKQEEIWRDEKALREEQDAAMRKKVDALELEQKAYDAKQDALQEKQDALSRERNDLLSKKDVTQAEIDAWQRKQDALQKERDDLWETEGKGLQERWDALEQEQKDQQKAFDPLRERQEELDKEREALADDQKPLAERQDELLKKQEELWALERSTQREVEEAVTKAQKGLDEEREDLQKQQDPLDKESQDLQARQKELWEDQEETEAAQEALRKEEEPVLKEQEELQKNFGEQYDELRDSKLPPLEGGVDEREFGGLPLPEPPGRPVPKGLTMEDLYTRTTVTYKLDENGEVEVDEAGNPVETTTTVTNKNTGLSYSETYRSLSEDGDSVTTIRSSDGSVTQVYTDVSPEGWTEGYMRRYVTDETGQDTLQIWTKAPDGEWVLNLDKETYLDSEAGKQDPQQRLDRPPAYLTVEDPLVDESGRPAGGSSSEEHTTQLSEGISRTDYTNSDGSVLKVVTNEVAGVRWVAGENNEVQEIWQRNPDGTWYLRDSITQHERYGDEPPLGTIGGN